MTFDALIAHGHANGASMGASSKNPEKSVPWSWYLEGGFHVTHEHDDLYLITTPTGVLRMDRDHVLKRSSYGDHLSLRRKARRRTSGERPE